MKFYFVAGSVITSGLCWYFANDLSGNYWYLLWVAPIPVLIASFRLPAKEGFFVAFIAYLLGRLSWLPYLLTVLPLPLAVFFTVLLPLIFALTVWLTRRIVLQNRTTWSAFAFPVFFCAFEFLFFKFSPDGTAGSISYAESNFLPVLQIASLTGILGVSFLITLFPSAIAVGSHFRFKKMKGSLAIAFAVIFISLVFGLIRLNSSSQSGSQITAGLVVLDEKLHTETDHPDTATEMNTVKLYAGKITQLAQEGAQVVVLPEKIANVTPATETAMKNIFLNAAASNHVAIVAGYTQLTNDNIKLNKALVISAKGGLLSDYQKVNLFEGEARAGFVPGKEISVFEMNSLASGVAICKDMDYSGFIRKYDKNHAMVMYVPAWDFIKDGWLHSRMAILRGVENGNAIVRVARQGQLTISDQRGKVLHEASSTNNKAATLIGQFFVPATKTMYSQFGDWFGYLILVAAIIFILLRARPVRTTQTKKGIASQFPSW
jgi:apolipoprotein N-acyltransferase